MPHVWFRDKDPMGLEKAQAQGPREDRFRRSEQRKFAYAHQIDALISVPFKNKGATEVCQVLSHPVAPVVLVPRQLPSSL